MSVYIDKQRGKPDFFWDNNRLLRPLAEVRYHQGRLMGRMEGMAAHLREEAFLEALTLEVTRSGELEGEFLSPGQVRSSLAARLGHDLATPVPAGIDAASAAGMMLDVLRRYEQPLTEKRLADWHISIAPAKRKRLNPMVHYQRPQAHAAPARLRAFLQWFNAAGDIDPVIKAGIAHWWFLTMHPFDGCNGRLARAITDMQLARADNGGHRYYSLSDRMCRERETYFAFVAETRKNDSQKGSPDITAFLEWYLLCLGQALTTTDEQLSAVMKKAGFWEKHPPAGFNQRQRLVLGLLLDGMEGKLTSSHWARLAATSSDSAIRDINELVRRRVLKKEAAGGRSTNYVLVER